MGRIRRRFLTTELCLYVGFLLADARCLYGLGTALKYVGILLCVAYAFSNAPHAVFAALFLTAAADLFLLVLNCWLALGVTLFIAVQALYAIHIARDTRRTYEIRAALVLAFWIVLWCLGICTSLNMLAGIYFPQLLCNAALSRKTDKCLALGLALFIACDICVGLWNLPDVPEPFHGFAGTGMWVFYFPSQVLIALTTVENPEKS